MRDRESEEDRKGERQSIEIQETAREALERDRGGRKSDGRSPVWSLV